MDSKIKHLEMISKVIDRMAQNSFHLKTWTITLTVAVLEFGNTKAISALFIIVGLGLLDVYYLSLEKSFRELYKRVTLKQESEIDFSMEIEGAKPYFCESIKSPSVWVFYLLILLAVGAYSFLQGGR